VAPFIRLFIFFFFLEYSLFEKIHYKSSQSKDYRLVLVRLIEAFLKPALALIYIVYNLHNYKDMKRKFTKLFV